VERYKAQASAFALLDCYNPLVEIDILNA
jgi:hypothetical protein